MTTSYDFKLPYGYAVEGQWNKRRYEVVRLLGQGANGAVYLVTRNGKEYALKLGFDTMDLQSEANVLAALSRADGGFRRFLLDVDDLKKDGAVYPFYVMKYVKGVQLPDFLERRGRDWFGVVGLRLLGKLAELHDQGWIFGDLKADNVLVSGYGEVELVDFGGVTAKGRAVKQFTEIHDRAVWNAGTRTADEGYDLFAFAVLCLQMLARSKDLFSARVLPQNRSAELLAEAAERDPLCRPYAAFLRKALHGRFATSREAWAEWRDAVHKSGSLRARAAGKGAWLGAGFAVSAALFLSALYLYLLH